MSNAPVFLSPSLKMNIQAIVTVAGLLKPDRPSLGVRIPETTNMASRIREVMSKETRLLTNKITANRMSPYTKSISGAIPNIRCY